VVIEEQLANKCQSALLGTHEKRGTLLADGEFSSGRERPSLPRTQPSLLIAIAAVMLSTRPFRSDSLKVSPIRIGGRPRRWVVASDKRVAANRANASKSTGPRTPAGKQRSAQNALQHGLTAAQVLLPDEQAATFDAFRAEYYKYFEPRGTPEVAVVEAMLLCDWRLRRVPRIEAGILRNAMAEHSPILDGADVLGAACGQVAVADTVMMKLARYEHALAIRSAAAAARLRDLQAARRLVDVEVTALRDADAHDEPVAAEANGVAEGSTPAAAVTMLSTSTEAEDPTAA
jgi:hypothetical protein